MPDSEDKRLLRYSRHLLLPQVGDEGQHKLAASSVLIVGLGGLGSPAAIYLASSGVGRLLIADYDTVELSNLQRQILHTTARIGKAKTDSAITCLRELNPDVELVGYREQLNREKLCALVGDVDVVVDASDNFATRYAINAACWQQATPLVSGAAVRLEAQISVFNPSHAASPCYQCLYPPGTNADDSCVNNGVLAPLTGVIGALQAIEVIKLLLNFGEVACGRVLLFDAMAMEWRQVKLNKNPQCSVCK